MTDWSRDPVVRDLREQISEADRAILEALNRRLGLVRRLHDYKRERDYPLLDPAREQALLEELDGANGGPLSPEGLREFFGGLLELTKREVSRRALASPDGSS